MRTGSSIALAVFLAITASAFSGDRALKSPNLPLLFSRYGQAVGDTYDFYGYSLTGIGDQNGDHVDDFFIVENTLAKVLLYLGGASIDTQAALVLHRNESGFGRLVANLGDINGDGKTDFAITSDSLVFIYKGGALDTVPMLQLHHTGAQIVGAGDVNRDGYDDILVGEPGWGPGQPGRACLYLGGNPMDTMPAWTSIGDSAYSFLGFLVSGGGDVNGDGYDDFMVAGQRLDSNAPVYFNVYFGGAFVDTFRTVVFDSKTIAGISSDAAIINDLNGDGKAEIAIHHWPDTTIYIYYGRDTLSTTPDLQLRGSYYSTPGYFRIASVGDLNGDGYNDLVVGNPESWGRLGEVLVYLGGKNMSEDFAVGWSGFLSMGDFEGTGQAVAYLGDVNGDGLNDIIFSSFGVGDPTRNGKVDIYGGDTSLVTGVRGLTIPSVLTQGFELEQNYPNPFNPSTTISYGLPNRMHVALIVFNTLGQQVATLVNGEEEAGYHEARFDASGRSSGVYFYRIQAGGFVQTKKLLLLK